MLIYPENEWNIYDEKGIMFPYYTHKSLNWINNNIPKNVSVLEIGGGNSTLWWRLNSQYTDTIETDYGCAEKLNCFHCTQEEINHKLKIIDEIYDVVIIDTDGDREQYVLSAFERCSKYFILDNWQQSEVMIYSDEIVDFLYKNTKEQHVFNQDNHKDWKTAIFIK
jgi:hypothetical protein